jgi:hypothetical protein
MDVDVEKPSHRRLKFAVIITFEKIQHKLQPPLPHPHPRIYNLPDFLTWTAFLPYTGYRTSLKSEHRMFLSTGNLNHRSVHQELQ